MKGVVRILAIVLCAGVLAIAGGLAYYVYAPRRTPAVQPSLVRLTESNLGELRDPFNAASERTRLLVLLSPT